MSRLYKTFCLLSPARSKTEHAAHVDRNALEGYSAFVTNEVDMRLRNLRSQGWNISQIWDHRGGIYGQGWREDSVD